MLTLTDNKLMELAFHGQQDPSKIEQQEIQEKMQLMLNLFNLVDLIVRKSQTRSGKIKKIKLLLCFASKVTRCILSVQLMVVFGSRIRMTL